MSASNPSHGSPTLKTGSLRDVMAVAGYVRTAQSGRRYVLWWSSSTTPMPMRPGPCHSDGLGCQRLIAIKSIVAGAFPIGLVPLLFRIAVG